jgi:hypothetical protein
MSFLNSFESKQDGVNDTVEFVIRVAIVTLSAVILVVVLALVVGLFLPNDIVDSSAILEMINPAFQTIIGALVGLLGGLSLNANARDKEADPEEPLELTPEMQPKAPKPYNDPNGTVFIDTPDDDDDEMSDYEKYRHDLRWDTDGDGVVSDDEIPDWVRRP